MNSMRISWTDAVGCPFLALEATRKAGEAQMDDTDNEYQVEVWGHKVVVNMTHKGEPNHMAVRTAEEAGS